MNTLFYHLSVLLLIKYPSCIRQKESYLGLTPVCVLAFIPVQVSKPNFTTLSFLKMIIFLFYWRIILSIQTCYNLPQCFEATTPQVHIYFQTAHTSLVLIWKKKIPFPGTHFKKMSIIAIFNFFPSSLEPTWVFILSFLAHCSCSSQGVVPINPTVSSHVTRALNNGGRFSISSSLESFFFH